MKNRFNVECLKNCMRYDVGLDCTSEVPRYISKRSWSRIGYAMAVFFVVGRCASPAFAATQQQLQDCTFTVTFIMY